MTLQQTQDLFTRLVCQLIDHAHSLGYEVSFGEAWRPQVTADYYAAHGEGIRDSLHTMRLAIDLNVFLNGKYQTQLDAYRPLGQFWETLASNDAKTRWGGSFVDKEGNPDPDCDHFSIEWAGKA